MSSTAGQGGPAAAGRPSDDKKGLPSFSFGNPSQSSGLSASTAGGIFSAGNQTVPSFTGASSGASATQPGGATGSGFFSGERSGATPSLFGQAAPTATPTFVSPGQPGATTFPAGSSTTAAQPAGTSQPVFGLGTSAPGANTAVSFGFGSQSGTAQTPVSATGVPKFSFGGTGLPSSTPSSGADFKGMVASAGAATPSSSGSMTGGQQHSVNTGHPFTAQAAGSIFNTSAGSLPAKTDAGQTEASAGVLRASAPTQVASVPSFNIPGSSVPQQSPTPITNASAASVGGSGPGGAFGFAWKGNQSGQETGTQRASPFSGSQTAVPDANVAASASVTQQEPRSSTSGKPVFSFGSSMPTSSFQPSQQGTRQPEKQVSFSFGSGQGSVPPSKEPVGSPITAPTGSDPRSQAALGRHEATPQASGADTKTGATPFGSSGGFPTFTSAAGASSGGASSTAAPASFRFGAQPGSSGSVPPQASSGPEHSSIGTASSPAIDSGRPGKDATTPTAGTLAFSGWQNAAARNSSTTFGTQPSAVKTAGSGFVSTPSTQVQSAGTTDRARAATAGEQASTTIAPQVGANESREAESGKQSALAPAVDPKMTPSASTNMNTWNAAETGQAPGSRIGPANVLSQPQSGSNAGRDGPGNSKERDTSGAGRLAISRDETNPAGSQIPALGPSSAATSGTGTDDKLESKRAPSMKNTFSGIVHQTLSENQLGTQTPPSAPTGEVVPASSADSSKAGSNATIVTIPSALEDKNVGEITIFFQETLNRLIEQFHRQAQQVTRWDRQVIEQQERLTQLVQETEHTEAIMHHLEKELDFILQQQSQMHKSLSVIEEQVKGALSADPAGARVWPSEFAASLTGAVEQERNKYHRLAEQLKQELDEIYQIIERTIGELNTAHGASGEERLGRLSSTAVAAGMSAGLGDDHAEDEQIPLLTILNVHLDTLELLNAQKNDLEQRIGELEKLLHTIGADPRFSQPPVRT